MQVTCVLGRVLLLLLCLASAAQNDKAVKSHFPVITSRHSRQRFADSNDSSDAAVSGEHAEGQRARVSPATSVPGAVGVAGPALGGAVGGGRDARSHAAPESRGGACTPWSPTPREAAEHRHAPRGRSALTCDGVQEHQVLEVGDLPPLPALRHVGGLVQLPGRGQRDPPSGGQTATQVVSSHAWLEASACTSVLPTTHNRQRIGQGRFTQLRDSPLGETTKPVSLVEISNTENRSAVQTRSRSGHTPVGGPVGTAGLPTGVRRGGRAETARAHPSESQRPVTPRPVQPARRSQADSLVPLISP